MVDDQERGPLEEYVATAPNAAGSTFSERFGGMQAPARALTDEEVMQPVTEGLYSDEIDAARESLMRQLTLIRWRRR